MEKWRVWCVCQKWPISKVSHIPSSQLSIWQSWRERRWSSGSLHESLESGNNRHKGWETQNVDLSFWVLWHQRGLRWGCNWEGATGKWEQVIWKPEGCNLIFSSFQDNKGNAAGNWEFIRNTVCFKTSTWSEVVGIKHKKETLMWEFLNSQCKIFPFLFP